MNQYNIMTGRWVDYHAGEVKEYNCGHCHTTGYDPEGSFPDMPGIVGSFVFPGITCERCHGAGGGTDTVVGPHDGTGTPREVLEDPLLCGQCHIRTSKSNVLEIQSYSKLSEIPEELLKVMTDIDAKKGMIRHHEQFEEWYNSPHREAGVTCLSCHWAHSGGIKTTCGECHTEQAKIYSGSLMYSVGVTCSNCHMAKTGKSAEGNPAIYFGDVSSHIFEISLSEDATLTYIDPETGKEYGNTEIPLGWACASPGCHGVKGVSFGTAYKVLPSGWDTAEAARIVANIQESVKEKLSTLKNLISEVDSKITEARQMGVSEELLSTPMMIMEEVTLFIQDVEADGTYGIHDPRIIDRLKIYENQLSFALSIIEQSIEMKTVLDEALNIASTAKDIAVNASSTAATASNVSSQSLMAGIAGLIIAIIAIVAVLVRRK